MLFLDGRKGKKDHRERQRRRLPKDAGNEQHRGDFGIINGPAPSVSLPLLERGNATTAWGQTDGSPRWLLITAGLFRPVA